MGQIQIRNLKNSRYPLDPIKQTKEGRFRKD